MDMVQKFLCQPYSNSYVEDEPDSTHLPKEVWGRYGEAQGWADVVSLYQEMRKRGISAQQLGQWLV